MFSLVYSITCTKMERIVKERELGDQRIKISKETQGSETSQYRDLCNLRDDEVNDFNKNWKKAAKKELLYLPVQQIDKQYQEEKPMMLTEKH